MNKSYFVGQMDRSYIEDDGEEREFIHEVGMERAPEKSTTGANPLTHMDFYQADPFSHCQNERMYKISSISQHFH